MDNTRYPLSLRIGLSAIAAVFVSSVPLNAADNGSEHRHHGAHVHGHGDLSFAADDNQVQVYLKAPADNFLGFEHAPQNDEQAAAISALKMQLKDMGGLFQINEAAKCSLNEVVTVLPDFAVDQHSDHDTEGHHHAHDEEEYERHPSDVEVTYDLTCGSLQSLKSVTVKVFDLYPGFEEIDAVVLMDHKQFAQTLTPGNAVLKLR